MFKINFIGTENKKIFALGDCCDIKEEKMALKVEKHAAVIAHNFEQIINNKTKLKEYIPSSRKLMIASIGRNNGIFQLGSFTFKGCVPTIIKSKDLFVPKYRKTLGYSK